MYDIKIIIQRKFMREVSVQKALKSNFCVVF